MDSIESVQKLNLNSDNLPGTWKDFRQNFEIYMLATESINKPEPVQIAILLNVVGAEAVKVYNTFKIPEEEKNCLKRVLDEFEKYCTIPRRNQMYDTYLFGKRRQTEYETFNAFVDDLKRMVNFCGYADEERMLRDRIVFGALNRNLQKRYFACEQLDLEGVIQMGLAAENEKKDMPGYIEPQKVMQQAPLQMRFKLCAYCNLAHPMHMKCPAYGQLCKHCNKLNHYSSVCRKKRQHDEQLLADLSARYLRS